MGVFPIKSVTLAAILDPGAACDLAGGASVAAALICASALQTREERVLRATECLCCFSGVTIAALPNLFACMHRMLPLSRNESCVVA